MARRPQHEEHENHEAWAIPYGDLVTLLLALFVVLYAVSSINEGKYRVLSDSLVAAFHGQPRSMTPIQIGDIERLQIRDDRIATIRPTQVLQLPDEAGGSGDAEGDREQADTEQTGNSEEAGPPEQGSDQLPTVVQRMAEAIELELGELIEKDLIRIQRGVSWVEVDINLDVLFASGSADIGATAVPILTDLAGILAEFPTPIRVEGHTDSRPISTSRYRSNWELSAARAASIVHLFAEHGVKPAHMIVAGLGAYRPLADNSSAEGRNRNRRVTIVVLETFSSLTDYEESVAPSEATLIELQGGTG